MSKKHPVRVRLVSHQDQGQTVQEYSGERIDKGSSIYIRYEESGEGLPQGTDKDKTITTVKIEREIIKIIRHGTVQSEQSFQLGRRLPGFYRSPYVNTQLSQETTHMHMDMQEVEGIVEWSYELFAYDESTGQFKISLTIQEEQENESE
ncbi:hypothetical protein BVG16_28385 [Paenibacillus selenitireducens]|uniref:DUF1934 domain-containing protein n=1 Tax=Paenibacillus selenitireducens TaxID=1324314 RepID=A0A1T2X0V2_9BACL|nr:DUF1934 domain-containing protein [Paenibacillus selenitireducens]OPA73548.1 hypothetical protein BVG16_28385 [Paenibacillus selenitireducens]